MKIFNLKKLATWMLVVILSCGLLTTSCTSEDNPVTPVDPTLSKSIDKFWDVPGNAGDPEVVKALKSIKNVEDLKPFMNVYLGQCCSATISTTTRWLTTTIPRRAPTSSRWY